MKRLLIATATLVFSVSLGQAGTIEDIISGLKSQGYQISEVEKTFFGLMKVEANKGETEREVVYNPFLDLVVMDHTDDDGEGMFNGGQEVEHEGNHDSDHEADHDSDHEADHDSDHDGDHDGDHDSEGGEGDHDGEGGEGDHD